MKKRKKGREEKRDVEGDIRQGKGNTHGRKKGG